MEGVAPMPAELLMKAVVLPTAKSGDQGAVASVPAVMHDIDAEAGIQTKASTRGAWAPYVFPPTSLATVPRLLWISLQLTRV